MPEYEASGTTSEEQNCLFASSWEEEQKMRARNLFDFEGLGLPSEFERHWDKPEEQDASGEDAPDEGKLRLVRKLSV